MTAIKQFKQLFARNRKGVDMTTGSIRRHILIFAFPLLIGNLFQQFYNMVDTWVVGNYVSNEAFSAVGSVGPIINTLIGFFSGLASGAGAVISQYFGAKREDEVQKAVHTSIVMTAILSVVLTVIGLSMTPLMLKLNNTPASVLPESTAYLTIYFAGLTGLLFYNMGAGILRAIGDSQRPFYYLVVAALINVVLDLVFVLKLGMGVRGVAYATIISQGVSALLTVITLLRTSSCVHVSFSKLRIDGKTLWQIICVGIPAGLQMAITGFSNVFVQSYINFFGPDAMAGWTAYSKLDQFLFLPMQSIALASTTFVAQNLGSGQETRAEEGVRTALRIAFLCTAVLGGIMMVFASPLVAFFNSKPEVVELGTMLMMWITPFYLLCCVNQILAGALRGSGNSRAPMIMMLFSFVAFRQLYLYTVSNFISNTLLPLAMSYPAGWLMASLLVIVYYKKVKFSKGRIAKKSISE